MSEALEIMQQRYVLTPIGKDTASFSSSVRHGLTQSNRSLPYSYLYDDVGSQLFEEICELPEYYVTRTEDSILRAHAHQIVAMFDAPFTLVELGSGSAEKTRHLIEAALTQHGPLEYIPVDVSCSTLASSSRELLDDYSDLSIHALCGTYDSALTQLPRIGSEPKLIAWLGSSIGNMDREDAARFLRSVGDATGPNDRMLVGIDHRKSPKILNAAYNDSKGVTARFNLNILARINRELGGDFSLANFEHSAVYYEVTGMVRLHLVSSRPQTVRIKDLGLTVEFDEGETIHTENSVKYSQDEIITLADESGWRIERRWTDEANWFSLSLFSRHTHARVSFHFYS